MVEERKSAGNPNTIGTVPITNSNQQHPSEYDDLMDLIYNEGGDDGQPTVMIEPDY